MTYKVKNASRDACQFCGLLYVKNSKTDQAYHRSVHEKISRIVYPKPLKVFIDHLKKSADPELVTQDSPFWMHKQMHDRARVFMKEFGYDSVQWSDGVDEDFNPHGFLISGATERGEHCIIGACAFREYKPGEWTLGWAWICPDSRHTGALSSRWGDFIRRFGDFHIDAPLSASMKNFVLKHGSDYQKLYFGDYLTRDTEED